MFNVCSSCVYGWCCALSRAVSRWVLPSLYCIKKKKRKYLISPPFKFFIFVSHWFIWSLSLTFQLAFPREPGQNTLNFRGDWNSEFCSSALNRTSMQALDSNRNWTHHYPAAQHLRGIEITVLKGAVQKIYDHGHGKGGCNKHRRMCISHCSDIVMFSLACNKPFVCVWPCVSTEIQKGQTGVYSTHK